MALKHTGSKIKLIVSCKISPMNLETRFHFTFIDFCHVHTGIVELQCSLKCWEELAKQGGVLQ